MITNNEEFIEKQADFAINFFRQTQLQALKSTVISPIFISIGLTVLNNGTSNNYINASAIEGEKANEHFANLCKELQKLKL
uniref:Uncharacterized protein n=1 Tax=Panagrolaimus sp. PS1159 TaxID=55785 RepID=A0AC35F292_9BILA